ncbi:MAG: hypothetical protein ABIJ23_00905 [Candidatus Magasanikbacteria bacterium]
MDNYCNLVILIIITLASSRGWPQKYTLVYTKIPILGIFCLVADVNNNVPRATKVDACVHKFIGLKYIRMTPPLDGATAKGGADYAPACR